MFSFFTCSASIMIKAFIKAVPSMFTIAAQIVLHSVVKAMDWRNNVYVPCAQIVVNIFRHCYCDQFRFRQTLKAYISWASYTKYWLTKDETGSRSVSLDNLLYETYFRPQANIFLSNLDLFFGFTHFFVEFCPDRR